MIYFNSWGIATFLCSAFSLLIVFFLLSIKDKALSTKYLAYFMFGVFLLSFGYLGSAVIPSPTGGFHRYITVTAVIIIFVPALLFAYNFLGNFHQKESRIIVSIMGVINLTAILLFYKEAAGAQSEFIFLGEIFDYPKLGKLTAILVLVYTFLFIFIMIRKAVMLKGKDRKTVIQSTSAILFIVLGPAISNMLMKKETISPALYHQVYVICLLLGCFSLVIVFINNAVEKTTFMTKIVGISLVSFLLIIQGISYMQNYLNNKNFDHILTLQTNSIINVKDFSTVPNLSYLVSFPLNGSANDNVNILYQKNLNMNSEEIKKYFMEDRKQDIRHSRTFSSKSEDLYVAYRTVDNENKRILEAGYSYYYYRAFLHESASFLVYYTLAIIFFIIILFPIFFSVSLIRPLRFLLNGVTEVNEGNLSIEIPVQVQDEIGFLSESFNAMVKNIHEAKIKLLDYADHLEHKVRLRTEEIHQKMEEIHGLKVQQDGDYFLTSLIQQPLITNWNKSVDVSTTFYIEQKKKFSFRERPSELGGDICVTGNLRFRSYSSRYVFFMNGDAMGKSMQGAGGAIVLGTAINNILSRSAGNDRVLSMSPEEWLYQTFQELNNVFNTFDGLMMVSAVAGLINPDTGKVIFFNAEHPYCVLFRDGKTKFIESGTSVRKMGSPLGNEFQLIEFKLFPGDVIIAGSDGRDDIDLNPGEAIRLMNEDETLFLKIVEEAKGELDKIVELIHSQGAVTDDLSLIRIGFKETLELNSESDSKGQAVTLFEFGKHNIEQGNIEEGLEQLKESVHILPDFAEAVQLIAQYLFTEKDYDEAVNWIEYYLRLKPDAVNFWFYLSVSEKHMKNFTKSLEAGMKVYEHQPFRIVNLINMADSYRMIGDFQNSRLFLNKALKLKSHYEPLNKLDQLLKEKGFE